MATDGERRLLDAAMTEFSDRGLAGARVSRISERAGANKQLIYAYFGDKDGLFDAALVKNNLDLNAAAPLDPHDLPGWVVTLFDYIIAHPEAMRLTLWQFLERPESVNANIERDYGPYLERVVEAQNAGELTSSISPLDLIVILSGMATSWYYAFATVRSLPGDTTWSDDALNRHRAALHEAARLLVTRSATNEP